MHRIATTYKKIKLVGRNVLLGVLPHGVFEILKGRFAKSETKRNLYAYERALSGGERRHPAKAVFLGKSIVIPDPASFCSAYRNLFVDESLKFIAKSNSPVIIDLGSNIGISVAYFKSRYPKAKVHAVEPDPTIFGYLKDNLMRLGYEDVIVTNMAAWNADEDVYFLPDGADGGRIENVALGEGLIRVPAFNTGDFLKRFERIDLLKVDVEGAEAEILGACENHLRKIERLFIEYHSEIGKRQKLDYILNILARNNFRINIKTEHSKSFPFLAEDTNDRYDNQLDIFAYR